MTTVSGPTGTTPNRLIQTAAAPARRLRRRSLRVALRDKRGATALVFAGAAVALFGFAALATEGGAWYVTQRNARSAADMAAMAGAMAYSDGSNQDKAFSIARETATRNGFTAGANTVVTPELITFNEAPAIRVTVQRTHPTFVSGLLLGRDDMPVRVSATAALLPSGTACILATAKNDPERDQLHITGDFALNAENCVLVSNAGTRDGVKIGNQAANGQVQAAGIVSHGGCAQFCTGLTGVPGGSVMTNMPVATNPYEAVDDLVRGWTQNQTPKGTDASCGTRRIPSGGTITQAWVDANLASATASPVLICPPSNANANNPPDLSVSGTVTLPAGRTYLFWNMGLQMQSGQLICDRCALIFTGPNLTPRTIKVNANSNDTAQLQITPLNAPGTALHGLSLYVGPRETPQDIQINGGGKVRIGGAMVFPESTVRWNGTSTINGTNCGVLIASSIQLNGTSQSTMGCPSWGTEVPRVQAVRLVM